VFVLLVNVVVDLYAQCGSSAVDEGVRAARSARRRPSAPLAPRMCSTISSAGDPFRRADHCGEGTDGVTRADVRLSSWLG
jgi:hypothetical protein